MSRHQTLRFALSNATFKLFFFELRHFFYVSTGSSAPKLRGKFYRELTLLRLAALFDFAPWLLCVYVCAANTLSHTKFSIRFAQTLRVTTLNILNVALVFLVCACAIFFFSRAAETVPLFKFFFFWGAWGFFGYIFVSGYIFFNKKHNYNKYTEALQRFWKRSFSIFWLLEGFIFAAFIYLTLNSSAEVVYSHDPQCLLKLHFFSWKIFIFKLVLLKAAMACVYFFSFCVVNTRKHSALVLCASIIVTYTFVVEFCQFLQFFNHSAGLSWSPSSGESQCLDNEFRRARTVNNYVLICSIAKFWHVVFIFFVWFYGASRFFESGVPRDYVNLASMQNLLVLYLLNWICMYPWFKLTFGLHLSSVSAWFVQDSWESIPRDAVEILYYVCACLI